MPPGCGDAFVDAERRQPVADSALHHRVQHLVHSGHLGDLVQGRSCDGLHLQRRHEPVVELHVPRDCHQQGWTFVTFRPQRSVHHPAQRSVQEPGQRRRPGNRTEQSSHQVDANVRDRTQRPEVPVPRLLAARYRRRQLEHRRHLRLAADGAGDTGSADLPAVPHQGGCDQRNGRG
uniref:(northern house mosquito) hypothetical protein n=1 Tax=Culex pipiens TaxID=7175 RepID=A0A8D8NAM0_CULPI